MTEAEAVLTRIEKLRGRMSNSIGHQLFATYVADLLENAVTQSDEEFEEELNFVFPRGESYDVGP